PAYPRMAAALAARAVAALGDGARLDLDPAGRPGVVAEAGGRRVDLTLAALADAVVDELAGEVERLWT
ncbi:MAG TPA: hypothetical protein VKP11_11800, partial [Frankiaceae bacterium]|nr:hypothetical protein [Frankiaceae bacterium]